MCNCSLGFPQLNVRSFDCERWDSSTGEHPALFVSTPGSLSGAYCSFPSCSWCLLNWWNGGTRPKSGVQTDRWGYDACEPAAAVTAHQVTASNRTTHQASVWYELIILFLLWFLVNMRLLPFRRTRSIKLKQTSPHHHHHHPHHHQQQQSNSQREKQWKFNFLAIRTSPS